MAGPSLLRVRNFSGMLSSATMRVCVRLPASYVTSNSTLPYSIGFFRCSMSRTANSSIVKSLAIYSVTFGAGMQCVEHCGGGTKAMLYALCGQDMVSIDERRKRKLTMSCKTYAAGLNGNRIIITISPVAISIVWKYSSILVSSRTSRAPRTT